MRRGLNAKGLLQMFDSLIYTELMPELTSSELRLLASADTLWLKTPEDIEYSNVLKLLPPRRRLLPKALRLRQHLDLDALSILEQADTASDYNDIQEPDEDFQG